ncbi:hypothetical protein FHN55_00880 [Streptomyces sp. NP160]|uniref:hypothetical protein n=1 Tax=Streptomyces sp. NP160 TaxID=2586637 RepID=UPI001118A1EE|nr:hypothetical protein [Streptomyces sp. NP160]TNM70269.1 hypothetical protein FHN55_00880 [Streptomyces sp. NP160]
MQHVAERVVVALSTVGLLAACSAAQPAPAGPTSVGSPPPSSSSAEPAGASSLRLSDGSVVVLAGQPPETVSTLGYAGRLVLLDGGCWGFADHDATYVLLLPRGTQPGLDGSSVVTPDGVTLRVGDATFSGGYGAGDGTPQDAEWRAAAPRCFDGRRGSALISIEVTEPAVSATPG